jgi:hypothetical protein
MAFKERIPKYRALSGISMFWADVVPKSALKRVLPETAGEEGGWRTKTQSVL